MKMDINAKCCPYQVVRLLNKPTVSEMIMAIVMMDTPTEI